jgi:small-conductance mechanosensitive channel
MMRRFNKELPVEFFNVKLIGLTTTNAHKVLLTVGFVVAVVLLRMLLGWAARAAMWGRENDRARFWAQQVLSLTTAVLVILGLVSIWLDNPAHLTTAAGLVTAGLAFALQKVITSVAAYFVILRSRTFTVGDRIAMGGVRGDVVALGFIQTTIMEMGEPPPVQQAEPPVWVKSRQYTGRVVAVTNDKIFDQPVYNYTRDFSYIWEEMSVPITYKDNRQRAEEIMLEVAERNTLEIGELSEEALEKMRQQYYVVRADLKPRVYYRITDNWLELTVRYVVREHGTRAVKDRLSRDILAAFDREGIGIASGTYDIVGLLPVRVKLDGGGQTC